MASSFNSIRPTSSGGGNGGSGGVAGGSADDVDIVTQLQTCLGQLTTQYYASVNYISTRHPLSAPIDSRSSQEETAKGSTNGLSSSNTATARNPPPAEPTINPVTGLGPEGEGQDPPKADPLHAPVPAEEFTAALRELAQDLVTKTRQIEALASRLPELGDNGSGGPGAEQARQEARIKELGDELEELRAEVTRAKERRGEATARLEGVIEGWSRSRRVV